MIPSSPGERAIAGFGDLVVGALNAAVVANESGVNFGQTTMLEPDSRYPIEGFEGLVIEVKTFETGCDVLPVIDADPDRVVWLGMQSASKQRMLAIGRTPATHLGSRALQHPGTEPRSQGPYTMVLHRPEATPAYRYLDRSDLEGSVAIVGKSFQFAPNPTQGRHIQLPSELAVYSAQALRLH